MGSGEGGPIILRVSALLTTIRKFRLQKTLIYALAERTLRQALAENNQTIPDQQGKPTQTPTMRWVFQLFEGRDVLTISQNHQYQRFAGTVLSETL